MFRARRPSRTKARTQRPRLIAPRATSIRSSSCPVNRSKSPLSFNSISLMGKRYQTSAHFDIEFDSNRPFDIAATSAHKYQSHNRVLGLRSRPGGGGGRLFQLLSLALRALCRSAVEAHPRRCVMGLWGCPLPAVGLANHGHRGAHGRAACGSRRPMLGQAGPGHWPMVGSAVSHGSRWSYGHSASTAFPSRGLLPTPKPTPDPSPGGKALRARPGCVLSCGFGWLWLVVFCFGWLLGVWGRLGTGRGWS